MMASATTASGYWLGQGARVAWFLGQYFVGARLTGPLVPGKAAAAGPPPSLTALLRDLAALLREDWRNLRAGVYRLAADQGDRPLDRLKDAVAYFRDLPAVNARRRRNGFDEVTADAAVNMAALPAYYRRNFHFQTDGYLSDRSARLYDQQVDVLFLGGADAMRRQAMPAIAGWLRRRRPTAPVRLVDVGCGTGRFLAAVAANFPALTLIGIDLSRPYLAEAGRTLGRHSATVLVQGAGERLPLADASVDLVTAVYLFHELPAEARGQMTAEFARVLRPGGRVVMVDSLQFGDWPAYDPLLETFPLAFHEPYYLDYARSDLAAVMARHGLRRHHQRRAFLSKVMVFDRT